ncbi:hypothetical protein [Brenneria tiliae]|uniref:DUF4365 domain-containing protein n=1 Tax=Brenneria tiliae TaxID=2914984 RepID=A0ABT0MWS4_9GAMM|nr:hypothetical protein [Brenneria tiliae]MCL2894293.1 hypothetical protein [Brenneria tiliae]
MGRNLGNMGESKFKLLCASAGIICNSSKDDDQAGWDFILDFPHETHLAVFADLAPQALCCKVQVKATDSVKKQVQIPLSNLLRLVNESNPVFIFFLEFDGKDEPESAYLLHIDKKIIASVLKKSREISLVKQKKLNKTTMLIKYDESQKLDFITGSCLKHKIEMYISSGMRNYVKNKQELIRSLGFENGIGEFQFKTKTRDSFHKMTKALLGVGEPIDVFDAVLYDKRFDIRSINTDFKNNKGKLTFLENTSSKKSCVVIKNKNINKKLYFDCDLYVTPLGLNLPDGSYIIRLSHYFFDLLLRNNGTVEYNFKLHDKKLEVNKLKQAIDLVNWICFSDEIHGNGLDIEIQMIPFPQPLICSIKSRNDLEDSEKYAWINAKVLTSKLVGIINMLDFDISITTQLKNIQNNHKQINAIHDLLNPKGKDIHFEFQFDPGTEKIEKNELKKCCCIYGIKIDLGDFSIIPTHAIIGEMIQNNKKYSLRPAVIINEGGLYFKTGENEKDEIDFKIESIYLKYKKQGYKVFDCMSEAAF